MFSSGLVAGLGVVSEPYAVDTLKLSNTLVSSKVEGGLLPTRMETADSSSSGVAWGSCSW